MGLAKSMRNLTQEIAQGFDTRVAGLAALRHETAIRLKGFRREMAGFRREFRRKAAALRQLLQMGREARSRQVSDMLAGFDRMLAGFRQDSQAAAGHWRSMAAELAKRRASPAR